MRHIIFMSVLALLLVPALRILAQPEIAPTNRKGAEGQIVQMARELNLTNDQQAKMNEKMAAMKAALDAWGKDNRDKLDKLQNDLRAAEQANNKEAVQQLRGQLTALQNERNSLQAKYRKDIMDVLTPEQQATWAGLLAYQQGEFAMVRKMVQLTPEQEAKLKEQAKACAAAQAKWDQENGEKSRQLEQQIQELQTALTALRASQNKLNADNHAAIAAILTPEQQADLAAARLQQDMLGRLYRVKLTEEQLGKIKPLCQAAAADISKLSANDEKARRQAMEKLYQTICDQVLTDAQRAELKK